MALIKIKIKTQKQTRKMILGRRGKQSVEVRKRII